MKFSEKIVISFFTLAMVFLSFNLYYYFNLNINQNFLIYNTASLNNAVANNQLVNEQTKQEINIIENVDYSKKLTNPPEIINAIYLTSWSAKSDKYYNNYLENILSNTEINSVVIDIKDYTGYVSYLSGSLEVKKYKTSRQIINDLPSLIEKLHKKNIYIIARISVFEDPAFAKARPDLAVFDISTPWPLSAKERLWKDNNNLYWPDPSSIEVQDYNISIAKDAFDIGFDEVNFDYIRFPSDGKTSNMAFPVWDGKKIRHEVIKEFFTRLRESFPNDKISADLFGQATVNYDDLGIGQIIEDSFEYFDFVCPMIYPSHYAKNFMGFENPALYPYDVVKYSMQRANERLIAYNKIMQKTINIDKNKKLAKIRPWLQDFNMGAVYTADMVKEQITAAKEALDENYVGYIMWNPSNVYKIKAFSKDDNIIK